MGADALLAVTNPPWLLGGLLDEPAHLATAGLVLANLPPRPRPWAIGFLAGSVALDVDHLPLIPRRKTVTHQTPRPPAHTALAPLAVASLAVALPSRAGGQAVAGAAWGTCAHLARDLFTGPGVALASPLSRRELRLPWAAYAAGTVALTVRAARIRANLGAGP